MVQTGNNLNGLNKYLFEGPTPGLLPVFLLFLTFTLSPADYLLLAVFVALPSLYFFYGNQDLFFGPRFLYEGLAPIPLLSARGIIEIPKFVRAALGAEARTGTRNLILIVGTFSLIVTAVLGLPRLLKEYGTQFCGVDNRICESVSRQTIRNAVVFVGCVEPDYYSVSFLHNAPGFSGPVIYARDHGPENYLLMLRFPGRSYYYADRDTLYRITNLDSLRNSPEMTALQQAGRFIRDKGIGGYRFILLPYREAGAFVDTGSTPCFTFREVGSKVFAGRAKVGDYSPALAVFMPNDPRWYHADFERMRKGEDFLADGCRFTVLFRTVNGKCVAYDIRPVDGPAK